MHLHRTGKNKICLRTSYKDGGKVRKTLIAVVSMWNPADLAMLGDLLKARRSCLGEARHTVDAQIYGLLYSHVPASKQWRLFQCRPAPRLISH